MALGPGAKRAPASDDATKSELAERAAELNIEGRSSMSKDELVTAVAEAESTDPSIGDAPDEEDDL